MKARKTVKGRLPKARTTLKCSVCPRPITLKSNRLCIDCFLETIYRDCTDLRRRVELVDYCSSVPVGPLSHRVSEEDRQAMEGFYGLDGLELLDRLDYVFTD